MGIRKWMEQKLNLIYRQVIFADEEDIGFYIDHLVEGANEENGTKLSSDELYEIAFELIKEERNDYKEQNSGKT